MITLFLEYDIISDQVSGDYQFNGTCLYTYSVRQVLNKKLQESNTKMKKSYYVHT